MDAYKKFRQRIGVRLAATTRDRADALEIWGGAHLAALAAQSHAADTYDEADWIASEHREAIAHDALENTEAALEQATWEAAL